MISNIHGYTDSGAFVEHLKQSAMKHYGHVGPRYLQRQVNEVHSDPDAITTRLQSDMDKWLEGIKAKLPADASHQIFRVAKRFALIGAAGEQAIRWGLLPLPVGAATDAATTAWKDYLSGRASCIDTEDQRLLTAILDACRRSSDRFASGKDFSNTRDCLGLREDGGSDADGTKVYDYLFTRTGLMEVCGCEMKRILAVLKKHGWLTSEGTSSEVVKVSNQDVPKEAAKPAENGTGSKEDTKVANQVRMYRITHKDLADFEATLA